MHALVMLGLIVAAVFVSAGIDLFIAGMTAAIARRQDLRERARKEWWRGENQVFDLG